jgi:hypothetical protein
MARRIQSTRVQRQRIVACPWLQELLPPLHALVWELQQPAGDQAKQLQGAELLKASAAAAAGLAMPRSPGRRPGHAAFPGAPACPPALRCSVLGRALSQPGHSPLPRPCRRCTETQPEGLTHAACSPPPPLQALHRHSQNGSPGLQACFQQLVWHCNQVLYQQLTAWCGGGGGSTSAGARSSCSLHAGTALQ